MWSTERAGGASARALCARLEWALGGAAAAAAARRCPGAPFILYPCGCSSVRTYIDSHLKLGAARGGARRSRPPLYVVDSLATGGCTLAAPYL